MNALIYCIKKYILPYKLLLLVLIIASIFRFFHLYDLQFWSTDEELIAHFGRKIVEEHKIFLISPNFTISSSLGSAFHMFTGVLYWIAKLKPERVLIFGTLLSLLTIILLYHIGIELENKVLGAIAALLYAASLLMSLYDRRWWTLTTAPFFTALSLFGLLRLYRKKIYDAVLLAIGIVSSWQVDPNMAIIPVASLLSIMLIKIKCTRQQFFAIVFVCTMSFIPLAVFEFRHPGTIVKPVLHQLTTKKDTSEKRSFQLSKELIRFPQIYSQYIASSASATFDAHFNWIAEATPLLSVWMTVAMFCLLFLLIVSRLRKKYSERNINKLYVLLLFWAVSICSLLIFSMFFHRSIGTHYVHVSMPIVFLLIAVGIYELGVRNRLLAVILLGLYVMTNTLMLDHTTFQFPLYEKKVLVQNVVNHLQDKQFSLHMLQQGKFVNTGFTGLFILQHANPVKSTDYMALDWWYRTQSLYFTAPVTGDPGRVVLIGEKGYVPRFKQYELYYTYQGAMEAVILDNATHWFDINTLFSGQTTSYGVQKA